MSNHDISFNFFNELILKLYFFNTCGSMVEDLDMLIRLLGASSSLNRCLFSTIFPQNKEVTKPLSSKPNFGSISNQPSWTVGPG